MNCDRYICLFRHDERTKTEFIQRQSCGWLFLYSQNNRSLLFLSSLDNAPFLLVCYSVKMSYRVFSSPLQAEATLLG